ncbi:MAG: NAD-dependent epimerase/dehydratase family protein, partial [Actinomycetota bacterium]
MRVLLTGGTGLLGSYTAAALRRAGHDVRLLVRTPEKVGPVFAPHGVSFEADDVVTGDITDPASIEAALSGCEAVVHAAAVTSVERRRAAEVLATNAAGVRNVVGAAVEAGLDPIVHTSSVSALFPPDTPMVTPDTAVARPDSPYGRSKAEAEVYARDQQAAGHPVTIVYPGGIWGPHDPNLGPNLQAVVTNYESGTPIVKGSGWSVVDVLDVADLIVAAIEPDQGPRRYVLGGHNPDTDQLNRVLTAVGGRKVRRIPMPGGLLRGVGRLNDAVMRVVPVELSITGEGMQYLTRWPG